MWWLIYIGFGLLGMSLYIKVTTGRCHSRTFMTGKVVLVTGGSRGIGYETARELARRGASVVIACRDEKSGKEAVEAIVSYTKNSTVRYQKLDLSSLQSVRDFVEEFKKHDVKLDVLVNNAGAYGSGENHTADGIVRNMQVNHFGPFLLTVLLVPLLKKASPSRVINVTSTAHAFGTIEGINDEGRYGNMRMYCNSKLCNVLFTKELSRRLEGTGVVVNSAHPGAVHTKLVCSGNFMQNVGHLFAPFIKKPREGAQTNIQLAVSDDCDQVTGKYFADCAETKPFKIAEDTELARRLWTISEELVKLRPEEVL